MEVGSLRLTLNNLDHNPRKARGYRREIDPLERYLENELRSRYHFGREGLKLKLPQLQEVIFASKWRRTERAPFFSIGSY